MVYTIELVTRKNHFHTQKTSTITDRHQGNIQNGFGRAGV
jgi:hypothetical protein